MAIKVFYGDCKNRNCLYQYSVADRIPSFCPECGGKINYPTTRSLMEAKLKFKLVQEIIEVKE